MTDTDRGQKLIIAGPGRAGTTLLVRILDQLGFETGADRLRYYEQSRAGLEIDILAQDAPYVVKDPRLSVRLGALLRSGQITREQIDHVVVATRNLHDAAASRFRVSVDVGDNAPGGLWRASGLRAQQRALAEATYRLVVTLATHEIPHILIAFPRLATDPSYAYRCLRPILHRITEEDFTTAWKSLVNPAWINDRTALEVPRRKRLVRSLRPRRRRP